MGKNLVIIDADGLIYHSSRETLDESIKILNDKINNIFDKTKSEYYAMFISKGKYFRHEIDSEYKSNRKKYPSKLKWIKTLKSYLEEEWNAQSFDKIEADDLCAYSIKNLKTLIEVEVRDYKTKNISKTLILRKSISKFNKSFVKNINNIILSSPDKDLLKSIPGKHFNYTYVLTDEAKIAKKNNAKAVFTDDDVIKGWWVETDEKKADFFVFDQMIIGDAADNIIGLKGKGEAYCKKLSKDKTLQEYKSLVFQEYIKEYGDFELALNKFYLNYRLLRLLSRDEDFIKEIGYLKIENIIVNEVKKKNEIIF